MSSLPPPPPLTEIKPLQTSAASHPGNLFVPGFWRLNEQLAAAAAAAGAITAGGGHGLLPIGYRLSAGGDWHRPHDDSGPSSPRSSSSPICSRSEEYACTREEYSGANSPGNSPAPVSPPESDESGLDLTKK